MGIHQEEGQRRKHNKEQGPTCCKRLWAAPWIRLSQNALIYCLNGINPRNLGYHCSQTIKDPTNGYERSLSKQDPEGNNIHVPTLMALKMELEGYAI